MKKLSLFAVVILIAAGALVGYMRLSTTHAAEARHDSARPSADPQSKDAVLAVYKELEKAIRNGDGNLYLSLQNQASLDAMEDTLKDHIRKGVPANPSVRYDAIAARVQVAKAIAIGKVTDSKPDARYEVVIFDLENGQWKIAQEDWSDTPIDPAVIATYLPPDDGAFGRCGSPWEKIAYADLNAKWFQDGQLDWKMQATRDESFLYIRFEAKRPLPAPGIEITSVEPGKFPDSGGPGPPPIMKIKLSTATEAGNPRAEFELQAGEVIQTRATFDKSGKADSNRYFVQYSITVRKSDEMLFTKSTDNPLVSVHNSFLDLKIPLESLGISGVHGPPIELEEANSEAKILPYQVKPFVE